jgi:hypothetical protein
MVRTFIWLELILELSLWSTAQTSMRDSLSMMDRPEPLLTLNQVTTATQLIRFHNNNGLRDPMERTLRKLVMIPRFLNTAQTLMRDLL